MYNLKLYLRDIRGIFTHVILHLCVRSVGKMRGTLRTRDIGNKTDGQVER